MATIILASASPRREELLKQVGCDFKVITSAVDEDNSRELPPPALAVAQAADKALDVAAKIGPDHIVVGADTVVVLAGQVYGKPACLADARRMLTELAGKEHQVITGVAVVRGARLWTDHCITAVKMRPLSAAEIDRYLASEESLGKAGAYAIQGLGALLIEGISGCYANVVGLPLVTLDRLLRSAGGVGLL